MNEKKTNEKNMKKNIAAFAFIALVAVAGIMRLAFHKLS